VYPAGQKQALIAVLPTGEVAPLPQLVHIAEPDVFL
jgi:hypothetical protein